MSGHSKWAKTHRQKSAQDAKRGAIFTKLANLITMAAKEGGGDAENNFKLRLAVDKARSTNMPKDNIERAIKRGTGEAGGGNFEEVLYEIIGPAKSGFIVEAITDNKNRTVSAIKAILNKNNGSLGGPNSVLWLFKKTGAVVIDLKNYSRQSADLDELELLLIDAGAEEVEKNEDNWTIYTVPENLQKVINNLKAKRLTIIESSLSYQPKEELKIADQETQAKIANLYQLLSDLDDVSNIYTNAGE